MPDDVDPVTVADLPEVFCWTKFGTEAGEDIRAILARKEAERLASGGTFFWGIGNAIGPSVEALIAQSVDPEVVFTPMRSRAATHDIAPAQRAVWHGGIGLDGQRFELPAYARVTSRLSPTRRNHYALVCRSRDQLGLASAQRPSFAATHVENLRSGSKVGASQVTSVVRRIACAFGLLATNYRVSFTADLVSPYFVRLTDYSLVEA